MSHNTRTHAICSASAAERWLNCPGSVGLSYNLPEEESSPYAKEGTRAHELSERILRRWKEDGCKGIDLAWVDSLRPEYADTEFETGDGRTWGMVDYAMTYVNCCVDEYESFDPGATVLLEKKLIFNEEMMMFGTADFLVTGTKGGVACGSILDLKYGKKRVKTENNPQLAYYAVALRRGSKKKLQSVKVRIVQPRLDDFFQDVEYNLEALDAWAERLTCGAEKALLQIGSKRPTLVAGSWCFWCPARRDCPERQRLKDDALIAAFPD